MMEISAKTEDRLRIVSVQDPQIDAAVAIEFKDAMRAQSDDTAGVLVLDHSQVEFIDSSGLGAIVAALKNIGRNKTLALAGLTPTVARVFELTRMDSVFNVYPTVDGALAVLGKK